jgi:hypothetical protein
MQNQLFQPATHRQSRPTPVRYVLYSHSKNPTMVGHAFNCIFRSACSGDDLLACSPIDGLGHDRVVQGSPCNVPAAAGIGFTGFLFLLSSLFWRTKVNEQSGTSEQKCPVFYPTLCKLTSLVQHICSLVPPYLKIGINDQRDPQGPFIQAHPAEPAARLPGTSGQIMLMPAAAALVIEELEAQPGRPRVSIPCLSLGGVEPVQPTSSSLWPPANSHCLPDSSSGAGIVQATVRMQIFNLGASAT